MNTAQTYQHLIQVAEKLSITVTEQNLRQSGFAIKSGLCKIGPDQLYVVDKQLPLKRKIDLLADCLAAFDLERVYLVPAVRELLVVCRKRRELFRNQRQRGYRRKQAHNMTIDRSKGGGSALNGVQNK